MRKILVILVMLVAMNANAQWVQMSNGITGGWINCFAASGSNLFVGTNNSGIFLSTNDGINWMAVNNGLPGLSINSLEVIGSNLFASINEGLGGVYLSTNYGTSWNAAGLLGANYVKSLSVSGTTLFAGTEGGPFVYTTNNGTNWNYFTGAIPSRTVLKSSFSGSDIFIAMYFTGNSGGVYYSTDFGNNWNCINYGLPTYLINTITINGINLFAGSSGLGVFLTTNKGTNWVAAGLANKSIYDFAISGSNIFAGTFQNGVYLTTNNGINWIQKNQGFIPNISVSRLLVTNNYIFAGVWSGVNSLYVWRRSLSEIIGIQNISTETPSKYSLSQNYPNPFNSMCNVQFSMCNAGNVKLVVYDVQGREVQTLVNERLQPGTYEAAFDGSMLNSGVYFYKLVTNGFTETKKMLMIK